MQICTSLQTDNHASTPPLNFYRPDALPAASIQHQYTAGTVRALYRKNKWREWPLITQTDNNASKQVQECVLGGWMIKTKTNTHDGMSLLKEFDTDWCSMRPSWPTAKLCFRVAAKSIDESGLDKHTAVLRTERDVENTMPRKGTNDCKRLHFSNLTLHSEIHGFNSYHSRRMLYFWSISKIDISARKPKQVSCVTRP